MDKPFPAYNGDDPYVFVSYAHEDSSVVYPEIQWLKDQGFNIWYDEGISPGHEWREELGQAIERSALFLYFVTPNSARSENCRNELNFAVEETIPVISIYLEQTELTAGLKLTLSSRQAILQYEIPTTEYQQKLQSHISSHLDQPVVPLKVIPAKRSRLKLVAIVVVSLVFTFSILFSIDRSRVWMTDNAIELALAGVALFSSNALALEQGIAVLPFLNMSSDPDNEYFSDGMSEEIINALVKANRVNVIARTSSFHFKGKNLDAREIGHTLGVTHILEGSVRKANNEVRITVQLIDTITGAHLWSESYDRELQDVFAIQDEIATEVVKQIGSELTAADTTQGVVSSRGTSSRDAYELYLQATDLARSDDPLQLEKAVLLFEQSIALDREHVDSWVGLGETYFVLGNSPRNHRFLDETSPIAINAYRTALELDPTNTHAMGMLGSLLMVQEFRWKEGAALMKESVALNPYDAKVLALYGFFLSMLGQPEAASTIERAYRLNPFEPSGVTIKVIQLFGSGRTLEAVTLAATHWLDDPGYSANVWAAWAFARVSPVLAEKLLARASEIAGADHPVHKTIEAMIAYGRKDTVRFEALRAEVFDLARHSSNIFLLSIPWGEDQIRDVWDIQIRHGSAELVSLIFGLKPPNMPEEDWTRIKILTRRDEADIGPGAYAFYERTRDEQAALLAAAIPLSEAEWDRYVGLYTGSFPTGTARLERKGDELIAHHPDLTPSTRRVIPVGNHIFERLDFKQTYTFTLVDGQVTQLTRKWKNWITLNDTQVVHDKIE